MILVVVQKVTSSFTQSTCPSKSPLDLIHSDLWGPSPLLSHFGFLYYVIFVDDYRRFTWLYHLKRKSNIFSIFLEFKTFVENSFSRKIKAFQSDGGEEFQALQPLFKQHGILHRISCPHSPEQNGTAERKHRHIIEATLSLLQMASMPSKYWDEASSTTIYLINRVPSPLLKLVSSFELLFHCPPDYSFMKTLAVFATHIFALILLIN